MKQYVVVDQLQAYGPFATQADAAAFVARVEEAERFHVNDWIIDPEVRELSDPTEILRQYAEINR